MNRTKQKAVLPGVLPEKTALTAYWLYADPPPLSKMIEPRRRPDTLPRHKPAKSATILLVEDDGPLLVFFSTVLRREGYTIITAANGQEALDIAEGRPDEPIHILLSDVAMPYMGGIQLAVNLRQTRPDLLVLLTSGLPQKEVSDRCGTAFKADFLAKPFSVSDLAGKIKLMADTL